MKDSLATKCDFCGSEKSAPFMAGVRDYEYAIPGLWDVVKCEGCGLIRLDPFPTFEETLTFYPKNYVQYSPRTNGIIAPLYRRFVENQGRVMAAHVGETARVLDVGAGCGEFIKILGEQFPGWSITGVEPNAEAAEKGRNLWGLDIRTGTLESAGLAEASFDLVIITHVIEHVPSPTAMLSNIYKVLKPGGWLYGETENIDSTDFTVLGKYWGLFHIPRHLFFFTRNSLENIMGKAGFLEREIECTFNPGAWALGLQFLAEEKIFKRVSTGRTAYYPLLLLAAIPLSFLQLFLKGTSPAIRFVGRRPVNQFMGSER